MRSREQPRISTTLEKHLKPQLNLPRRKCRGGLAKLPTSHVANRVVQIDSVEEVEGLGLELHSRPVARFNVFKERQVNRLVRGTAKCVPAHIAVRADWQTW